MAAAYGFHVTDVATAPSNRLSWSDSMSGVLDLAAVRFRQTDACRCLARARTAHCSNASRRIGLDLPATCTTAIEKAGSRYSHSTRTAALSAYGSLPENELLTRFRHVYAGKGGRPNRWSTAANSNGSSLLWSVARRRYEHELLNKLDRSLRGKTPSRNKHTNAISVPEGTDANNKRTRDKTKSDFCDTDKLTDPEGSLRDADGRSTPDRQQRRPASSRHGDGWRAGSGRCSIAEASHPLASDWPRAEIIDSERQPTSPAAISGRSVGSPGAESTTNESTAGENGRPPSSARLTSSLPAPADDNVDGEDDDHSVDASCCDRSKRRSGRSSATNKDYGYSSERRSKSTARTSGSGPNPESGIAGSCDDGQPSGMTLLAQLSVEAQRALDETRAEMGTTSRFPCYKKTDGQKPAQAEVLVHAGDGGRALSQSSKLLIQQVGLLSMPKKDGAVSTSGGDVTARHLDVTGARLPPTSRRREPESRKSRFRSVYVRDQHRMPNIVSVEKDDVDGEAEVSSRVKPSPAHAHAQTRLKAAHGLGESHLRHSGQSYPRRDSLGKNGRLPQITSIDTSKLPRESELPWNGSHGTRIPGVGLFNRKSLPPHRLLTREQSFQITPFGYDSRFADVPMFTNEEDDTPSEVKAQAIEKCSEWMRKYMT